MPDIWSQVLLLDQQPPYRYCYGRHKPPVRTTRTQRTTVTRSVSVALGVESRTR